MKRPFAGIIALILLISAPFALADSTSFATSAPLPGYTLRPLQAEQIVFATMSVKGNIAGYLQPGTAQTVDVLQVSGEWCFIRFSTDEGMKHGYVPLSCFDVLTATPTPSPAADTAEYAAGTVGWIQNSGEGYRVSLRKEPAYSAASLGKFYTGTPVMLTGRTQDDYAEVLLAGTVQGWIDTRFITLDASALVPETPMVTVKNPGSGATLRSGASSSTDRLGWFAHGTAVTVLGVRADGWYLVTADGLTGYMSEGLLSGTFPYAYGTDSDNPNLTDAQGVFYINTRTAGGQLNLRKSASSSAKSLGRFYTGTPLTVLSYTRTGWAYVRIGCVEGYVDADYLTEVSPTLCGDTRTVRNSRATGVNLRAMPSTGGELLGFAENGESVIVWGDLADGWCYVSYGGQTGYMLSSALPGK